MNAVAKVGPDAITVCANSFFAHHHGGVLASKMDETPQDGTACKGEDEPVKACGQCGILYDSAYPTRAL